MKVGAPMYRTTVVEGKRKRNNVFDARKEMFGIE